jgi:NADH:ubiquinone reductase (non-electrogenic)
MLRKVLKYGVLGAAGFMAPFFVKNEYEKRARSLTKIARRKKVVVLGSGWGALSFIQQIDESAVDLKVVSPRSFFFYTPLLAGSATGTVAHNSIMEPMRWHTSRFGADSFIMAECKSVDFSQGKIKCIGDYGNELDLEYDHLVIAIGAEPATFNIPGVMNFVFVPSQQFPTTSTSVCKICCTR